LGAFFGLFIALACMLGGFVAMGGKLAVIWQPWEYLIIIGIAAGTFMVANSMFVARDTVKACLDAIMGRYPSRQDNITILHLLFNLLSQMKKMSRNDFERHIEEPTESEIFKAHPDILKDKDLTQFICDYCRLILIGSARPHEIESVMEGDIEMRRKDSLKPYNALMSVAESLPALGIVAAVLGIVKAMGAINQSPEILGSLIASALVGTFAGIFISYAVVSPLAAKVKVTREKQMRVYFVIKQTLIAHMNGAMPLISVEHGRSGLSIETRPTMNEVQDATLSSDSLKEAA
jgi:chemotaxis protein MotA